MNQGLILVDSNKSLSADYISPPVYMLGYYAINIQAIWTGTPVGVLSLETSLDYQPQGNVPGGGNSAAVAGNWATYTGSSQNSATFTTAVWDIWGTGARWFRVHYISTSGSGTLTKLLAQVKG